MNSFYYDDHLRNIATGISIILLMLSIVLVVEFFVRKIFYNNRLALHAGVALIFAAISLLALSCARLQKVQCNGCTANVYRKESISSYIIFTVVFSTFAAICISVFAERGLLLMQNVSLSFYPLALFAWACTLAMAVSVCVVSVSLNVLQLMGAMISNQSHKKDGNAGMEEEAEVLLGANMVDEQQDQKPSSKLESLLSLQEEEEKEPLLRCAS